MFLRSNWLAVLAIALFLWLILKPAGCGPNIGGKGGRDTVRVETRTEYIPQPPVYIPQYVPVQGRTQAPIVIPQQYQPSADYATLVKQYNELANKFLSSNTYIDSIPLKDSLGNNVGVVNLEDLISENQIKLRKPSYQLSFPHTTTTITLREPPVRQLYVGGGLAGGSSSLLNGVDVGLVYKNKKDRLFELKGGFRTFNGQFYPEVQLSTYWKIRLKK